jgi:hypothetical protein
VPDTTEETERAGISAAFLCERNRAMEKAGVFRRDKPPAGLAARCCEIQQYPLRIVAGIFLDDCPERREAS